MLKYIEMTFLVPSNSFTQLHLKSYTQPLDDKQSNTTVWLTAYENIAKKRIIVSNNRYKIYLCFAVCM